ncbi:MAG: MMPL family transporter [Bdellovibrionota bacterium]
MTTRESSSPVPGQNRAYLSFLLRNKRWINALAAVIAAGAIFFASHIYLKPSFAALLPDNLPSIEHLNRVTSEVGGTGLLLIGIESPSFKANRTFADRLAAKLKPLSPTVIKDFEYNYSEAREYFERFGLYYLRTEDLKKLKHYLQKEVIQKAEKKRDNAFASILGIDEKKEEAPQADATNSDQESKLFAEKIDPRIQRLLEYPRDYLATKDGKLVVIAVRTSGTSLSLGESRALTEKVRALIDELKPTSFHPELQVNFAGNVQRSLDEVNSVKADILDTAMLLVVLILVCLYLFFNSWAIIGLMVTNLLLAVVVTLGFAQLTIGYLNTLTAFMASLVVGTGINYACIFCSRYLEERRSDHDVVDSLGTALSSTYLATLAASSTTAVSFIALFFAKNKGFSEFALIGGVGIIVCWIATYTLLPIWIHSAEKHIKLSGKATMTTVKLGALLSTIGGKVLRYPLRTGTVLAVLAIVSAVGSHKFLQDPFEYDFTKLGNKLSRHKTGASGLHKRIQDEVYQSSMIPAVVLMQNAEQAKLLCAAAREKVNQLPEDQRNLQSCLTLFDILPTKDALSDESPAKAHLREEVKTLMGSKWLKLSDSKLASILVNMSSKTEIRPPTVDDVPDQLKRRFETKDGRQGIVGYIYSDPKKPLEDGRNLLQYTETFGSIDLPNQRGTIGAAGENFVLADLLRSIKVDGPKVSLLAFAGVLIVAFLLTNGLTGGIIMALCLICATVWMIGLQTVLGVKFNFLNFIALPLTFGIGIDYPINVYMRFKEQGWKDFSKAIRTTGVAVFLCSTTTIIGYLTLFEASNQAIASFAKLALIGEFTCLAATFLGMPLVFAYFNEKAASKT